MSQIVLAARPDYFSVVEGDNGHQEEGYKKWSGELNPEQGPDYWRARLLATWQAVADELTDRGYTLIQETPNPGLPDQVFAADRVVMAVTETGERRVVYSNMNSPQRQQEVAQSRKTLGQNGFVEFEAGHDNLKHEGTGDFIYLPGHNIYVQGYGPRSQSGIGKTLSRMLNQTVVEVPLEVEDHLAEGDMKSKNTKGFHLDTIVWALPNGHLIACFERMLPETRKFFESLYPEDKRIAISGEEADNFVTNGIVVRDPKAGPQGYVLFGAKKTAPDVVRRLKEWGFGFKGFDVEPSGLSGGALHCMFNLVFDINPEGAPLSKRPTFKHDNVKCYTPELVAA